MDKEYNEGWNAAKNNKEEWNNLYIGENWTHDKFIAWQQGWRDYMNLLS